MNNMLEQLLNDEQAMNSMSLSEMSQQEASCILAGTESQRWNTIGKVLLSGMAALSILGGISYFFQMVKPSAQESLNYISTKEYLFIGASMCSGMAAFCFHKDAKKLKEIIEKRKLHGNKPLIDILGQSK